MNMTNMNNPKPWAEGHPSLYQGHDITHRPDWGNIIVWDAFFNNLTAGFMVLTGIAWFAGRAQGYAEAGGPRCQAPEGRQG